jgi:hypothetical protein
MFFLGLQFTSMLNAFKDMHRSLMFVDNWLEDNTSLPAVRFE